MFAKSETSSDELLSYQKSDSISTVKESVDDSSFSSNKSSEDFDVMSNTSLSSLTKIGSKTKFKGENIFLDIKLRGKFETDVYFLHEQEMSVNAVIHLLEDKYYSNQETCIEAYKKMRKEKQSSSNRLEHVSTESDCTKILLDVGDIQTDTLQVQQNDYEVVVSGCLQDTNGKSHQEINFEKTITLPKSLPSEYTTTSLSADGFLLIKLKESAIPSPVDETCNFKIDKEITLSKDENLVGIDSKETAKFSTDSLVDESLASKKQSGVKKATNSSNKIDNDANEYLLSKSTDNNIVEVNESLKSIPSLAQQSDADLDIISVDDETTVCINACDNFPRDELFKEHKTEIMENLSNILERNGIEVIDDDQWETYKRARKNGKLTDCFIMSSKGKSKYAITLDTLDLKQSSLSVKSDGKYQIEVSAKSMKDPNNVFTRYYYFPEQIKNVDCNLSMDGILMINADSKIKITEDEKIESCDEEAETVLVPFDEYSPNSTIVTQQELDQLNNRSASQILSKSGLAQSQSSNKVAQSLSKIDLDKLILQYSTTLPTLKTRSSISHRYLEDIYHELMLRVCKTIKRYTSMRSVDYNIKGHDDSANLKYYKDLCFKNPEDVQRVSFVVHRQSEFFQIIIDMTEYCNDQFFISIQDRKTVQLQCFRKKRDAKLEYVFRRFFTIPHKFYISTMSSILTSDAILIISFTQDAENRYNKDLIRQISDMENDDDFFRYVIDFNESSSDLNKVEDGGDSSRGVEITECSSDVEESEISQVIEKIPNLLGCSEYKDVNNELMDNLKQLMNDQFRDHSLDNKEMSTTALSKGFSRYRDYKKKKFTKESQIAAVLQDKESFKVVLDASDIIDKSINVDVSDSCEVQVSADFKLKEKGKEAQYNYSKSSLINGEIDVSTLKVLKSEDNFLVITGKLTKKQDSKNHKTDADFLDKDKSLTDDALERSSSIKNLDTDFSYNIAKRGPLFDVHTTSDDLAKKMNLCFTDKLSKYKIDSKGNILFEYRKWRKDNMFVESQAYAVSSLGNKFRIALDVLGFHEDELKIYTTNDGFVMIEGWVKKSYEDHRSRSDFKRRFLLPPYIDISSIASSLTSDGFLIVSASIKSIDLYASHRAFMKTNSSSACIQDVTYSLTSDASSRLSDDVYGGGVLIEEIESISNSEDEQVVIPKKSESSFIDMFGLESYDSYLDSESAITACFKTSSSTDIDTSYRGLRKKNMSEDTQASCFIDYEDNDLVVIDVLEFLRGVIRVTVRGRFMLIEGYAEVLMDGVFTVFTFRRCYKLTRCSDSYIIAEITKDGLLVISFKDLSFGLDTKQDHIKKLIFKDILPIEDKSPVKEACLEIEQIGSFFHTPKFDSCNNVLMEELKSTVRSKFGDNSLDDCDISKSSLLEGFAKYRCLRRQHFKANSQIAVLIQDKTYFKIIVDVLDSISGSVKVKLTDSNNICIEAVMEHRYEGVVNHYDFIKNFDLNAMVKSNSLKSEQCSDGLLIVTGEVKKIETENKSTTPVKVTTKPLDYKSYYSSYDISSTKGWIRKPLNLDYNIAVGTRDNLYSGEVTEGVQRNMLRLFMTTLSKFGVEVSSDAYTQYRSLRRSNYCYDTQIFGVTRMGRTYYVLLDAYGFNADEITVTFTSSGYLVLTGMVNKNYKKEFSRYDFRRSYFLPYYVEFSTLKAHLTKDGFLIVSGDITSNFCKDNSWTKVSASNSTHVTDVTSVFDSDQLTLTEANETEVAVSEGNMLNPKENDSLFKDCYSKCICDSFMSSVRRILRLNTNLACKDLMASYRELRRTNLHENTQAWSICAEDNHSMIILDVNDYIDGDINIEVIDDWYIVIEGIIEKQLEVKGSLPAAYSFKRYFKLSKSFQQLATITELTKDGILVITLTNKMIIPSDSQANLCKSPTKPGGLAKSASLTKSGSCTEFCEVRRKGKKCSLPGYSKHFLCPSRKPHKHKH